MKFLNSESITVLIPTSIIRVLFRKEVRKLMENLTFSMIRKVWKR